MSELLEIKTLTVRYRTKDGFVTALDSVSLGIGENEMLALVGESGCGKTTLGLSIVSLLPPASSEVVNGSV
ncbi:MAG: ATP-binding cassette domain-containing protein, partial [Thaumarchaeota archaeon]